MKRTDDFTVKTKELLAKRVGMRCSNPNCRALTIGPSSEPDKTISIGVAAHITAAQPGGPRYDSNLSSAERQNPDNGIWCCFSCSKLVDSDNAYFTVDFLRAWKRVSEEAARLEIENPRKIKDTEHADDKELIRFYAQCLDRPAFQDEFVREGSMKAFDKAIEDTITALNTGCLRARDGLTLSQSKGKSYLNNPKWRQEMDTVVDLLRAIRSRYELGKTEGHIISGDDFHCVNDSQTAIWMDQTREELLQIFRSLAAEAGVMSPRWSGRNRRY